MVHQGSHRRRRGRFRRHPPARLRRAAWPHSREASVEPGGAQALSAFGHAYAATGLKQPTRSFRVSSLTTASGPPDTVPARPRERQPALLADRPTVASSGVNGRTRSPLLLRIETAVSRDRSSSSNSQLSLTAREVAAFVPMQKSSSATAHRAPAVAMPARASIWSTRPCGVPQIVQRDYANTDEPRARNALQRAALARRPLLATSGR